jgi:hypothetical protein
MRFVHCPLSGMTSASSAGSSAARATEDFPEPEAPTIATNDDRESFSTTRAFSGSRPKKNAACSFWNGSRPR